MPQKKWLVIDSVSDVQVESLQVGPRIQLIGLDLLGEDSTYLSL
jgi:hypothetical protein